MMFAYFLCGCASIMYCLCDHGYLPVFINNITYPGVDKIPVHHKSEFRPFRLKWKWGFLDTDNLTFNQCYDLFMNSPLDITCNRNPNRPCFRDNAEVWGPMLTRAMEDIQVFLHDLLKVVPYQKPIIIKDTFNIPIPKKKRGAKDADFFIFLLIHTMFTDTVLAHSFVMKLDEEDDYRPIAGVIAVNNEFAFPDYYNREFFNVLLHEVFHLLGLSEELYRFWKVKEYPLKRFKIKKTNHSIWSMTSPNAVKFVEDRFGYTPSQEGDPVGIEMYNKTHVSRKTYFGDIMNMPMNFEARITNATLALLKDTGWYIVNDSLAETIAYGDPRSLGMKTWKNFPFTPPQMVLPKHYIANTIEIPVYCGYDYRGVAAPVPMININCARAHPDNECCNEKRYYNPLGRDFVALYAFDDHVPILDTVLTCQYSYNKSLLMANGIYGGMYFGNNSYCANSTLHTLADKEQWEYGIGYSPGCYYMECRPGNQLYIGVDGILKRCNKTGQRLEWKGYYGYIECPPPLHVCAIMNYSKLEKEYIPKSIGEDPNFIGLKPKVQRPEGKNSSTKASYHLDIFKRVAESARNERRKRTALLFLYRTVAFVIVALVVSVIYRFVIKKRFSFGKKDLENEAYITKKLPDNSPLIS